MKVYGTEESKPEKTTVWRKQCKLNPEKKLVRPSGYTTEDKYFIERNGQYIRTKPKSTKCPKGTIDILEQY